MRKREFLESLERVRGLAKVARSNLELLKQRKHEGLQAAMEMYGSVVHRHGALEQEPDSEILDVFNLDKYVSAGFWTSYIRRLEEYEYPHEVLLEAAQTAEDFVRAESAIRNMLGSSLDEIQESSGESLTLILPEEAHVRSSPHRLMSAISSVSTLYAAFAEISGHEIEGLSVLACDSGSDKSFDFLGVAEVVKQVKEAFFEFGQRLIFYRQIKAEADAKVFAEQINAFKQAEAIEDPEARQRFKFAITKGLEEFAAASAFIPELETAGGPDVRLLAQPAPKLLEEGAVDQVEDGATADEPATDEPTLAPGPVEAGPGVPSATEYQELVEELSELKRELKRREQADGDADIPTAIPAAEAPVPPTAPTPAATEPAHEDSDVVLPETD